MPSEAVYFASRAVVRFAIYPEGFKGARILAEISTDALREVFGAHDDGSSLLATYQSHFARIQNKALSCYYHAPSIPVQLESADFFASDALLTAQRSAVR